MVDASWPPPEGLCPMPNCNGIIEPLALTLDARGRGECGRCGNFFEFDGKWRHVDEVPDKPAT